jgi:threonine dehydratase
MSAVTWEDVRSARVRIADIVHRTPVVSSATADRACRGRVYFKCENFQRTGSFKLRGASNAVSRLSDGEKHRGVCAASSGNFAQALALAARLYGTSAHLVMPKDSTSAKVAATIGYGASITFCEPTHVGREQELERVRRETGAVLVHSHDDLAVIAGQGTAACELIEDAGGLDLILAPVGGGGLISGTLVAAKHLLPDARVIGCEPAGADDAARSLRDGARITDFTPDTIADGLRTPLGEHTFRIVRALIDEIVVVPEADILPAMRFVWERMKLVIEPSSAVAVAPLLTGQLDVAGLRVGVILSGGNVNLDGLFGSSKG